LIDEIIDFRDRTHKDSFRFVLTPKHWKALYASEDEVNANGMVTVTRNGVLRGYAAYSLVVFGKIRTYEILDICADAKEVANELIEQIVESGLRHKVDMVFTRNCKEAHDDIFAEKGFLSFVDTVVMAVLLSPRELLQALSKKTPNFKVLRLSIKGFEPVTVKVGKEGITVVSDEKADLSVWTDNKTFMKLFFGKTRFLREFVKGKITIDNVLRLLTAWHFFNLIKQEKWYIPLGDWI